MACDVFPQTTHACVSDAVCRNASIGVRASNSPRDCMRSGEYLVATRRQFLSLLNRRSTRLGWHRGKLVDADSNPFLVL
jgi:hypothetical protein